MISPRIVGTTCAATSVLLLITTNSDTITTATSIRSSSYSDSGSGRIRVVRTMTSEIFQHFNLIQRLIGKSVIAKKKRIRYDILFLKIS